MRTLIFVFALSFGHGKREFSSFELPLPDYMDDHYDRNDTGGRGYPNNSENRIARDDLGRGQPSYQSDGKHAERIPFCPPCPLGFIDKRKDLGKCYKEICHDGCYFQDAFVTCQQVKEARGVRLVEPDFENEAEMDFISEIVHRDWLRRWWIGAKRKRGKVKYATSGKILSERYISWARGEPNGSGVKCLSLDRDHHRRVKVYDHSCHGQFGFGICELWVPQCFEKSKSRIPKTYPTLRPQHAPLTPQHPPLTPPYPTLTPPHPTHAPTTTSKLILVPPKRNNGPQALPYKKCC